MRHTTTFLTNCATVTAAGPTFLPPDIMHGSLDSKCDGIDGTSTDPGAGGDSPTG